MWLRRKLMGDERDMHYLTVESRSRRHKPFVEPCSLICVRVEQRLRPVPSGGAPEGV